MFNIPKNARILLFAISFIGSINIIFISWYSYEYYAKITSRAALVAISGDMHTDDKIVVFITTADGTIIQYPKDITLNDIPDNKKFKTNIYLTADGSAVILNSSLKYSAFGPDIVWKSNGKFYGILSDYNKDNIMNKERGMFLSYATPEVCECPRVILMEVK